MVTLCLVTLCVCVALVTDFGMAYVNKRQAQTAADAAVLAAGSVFAGQSGDCSKLTGNTGLMSSANAAADQLRLANLPGSPDVDLQPSCTASDLTLNYVVNIDSPLGFGQMVVGTDHLNVNRGAQVTLSDVTCGLCFLGTGSMGTGNADYRVDGGNIQINGNLTAGPNGVWTVAASGTIGINGTVSGGQFSKPPVKMPVIPDPLAAMQLPLSMAGLTDKLNPCTDGPGIYGSVQIPSGCDLAPGAYVITGSWSMKNNSTLTNSIGGVTLYFRSPNGMLDVKNGTINNLSAPSGPPVGAPSGWPSGFAIIYDRDNLNNISAQGNGSTTITGGIYGQSATLDFNGNSAFHISGGPIVVASGTGNGNPGTVTIDNSVNVGGTKPMSAGGVQMTK